MISYAHAESISDRPAGTGVRAYESGDESHARLGPLFATGLFGLMVGPFAVAVAERHIRKTMLIVSSIRRSKKWKSTPCGSLPAAH